MVNREIVYTDICFSNELKCNRLNGVCKKFRSIVPRTHFVPRKRLSIVIGQSTLPWCFVTCHGLKTVDQSIHWRLTVKLVGRLGNLFRLKLNPSGERTPGYDVGFRLHGRLGTKHGGENIFFSGKIECLRKGLVSKDAEPISSFPRSPSLTAMKPNAIKLSIVRKRSLAVFCGSPLLNALRSMKKKRKKKKEKKSRSIPG